ncbi:MAG: hypothetical protein ACF8R7_15415 [Phycisphaerales bacterium JB039]
MLLRLPLLLAALLALLPMQQAAAQNDGDPEAIARRCVQLVDHRADRSVEFIADTTEQTIQRIRRLDAAGAPDERIINTGKAGALVVNRTARWAIASIDRLTRHCVRAMIDAGATRELVRRVVEATDASKARIAAASDRATNAIHMAVREALR